MKSEWGGPALPSRALLVAPTVEGAAVLGTAFEEALAAPLDEVAALLATEGHDLPCVAVTGIPTRGGRLAAVLGHVLDACPDTVQVVIAVTGPSRADLADGGADALRGLVPIDLVQLSGVPCLRLRRAPDRDDLPQLGELLSELEADDDPQARLAAEAAEALLARAGDPALREQLAELQQELQTQAAELAAVREEQASAQAHLQRLRARPWGRIALAAARPESADREGRSLDALRRRGGLIAVGVLLVAAVAVTVALLTDAGYVGAMVTAALGLALVQMAYTRRAHQRLCARLERTAAATREVLDALDARARDAERRQVELTAQIARLQRNVAIMTASSVDTAQSVAKVADRMRGAPPDLGPR